jgi:hypothetical protein
MLEHPVKKQILVPGTIERKYIKVWMQSGRRRTLSPAGNIQHAPHQKYLDTSPGIFFGSEVDTLMGKFLDFSFYVRYSTPFHLPPL